MPSILEEEIKGMMLAYLKLFEYPDEYTTGELENYIKNKVNNIEQYIKKNEIRDIYDDMGYEYRSLINLKYNTFKLFLEIMKEYSKQQAI